MGDCAFKTCNRDHPWTPGYPGGCPFGGEPGRPRPQPEATLSAGGRLHVQQLDAQLRAQAAAEARDREIGIMRTLVRELVTAHHKQVTEQLAADLAPVRDLAAAQRAADAHEVRALVHRVTEKL